MPVPAASVSREVGLLAEGHVLEGHQLGEADPAEVSVFARVKLEDKLAIVRALQERGDIIAVTGDGGTTLPRCDRRISVWRWAGLAATSHGKPPTW